MSEDLAAAMAAALGRGFTAEPDVKVHGGSNCEKAEGLIDRLLAAAGH